MGLHIHINSTSSYWSDTGVAMEDLVHYACPLQLVQYVAPVVNIPFKTMLKAGPARLPSLQSRAVCQIKTD